MKPSTRRAVLAACTALLLVTAGCSGGANPTTGTTTDGATPTATATSTPTTGTDTWSPNASVEQYPPGVADNGTLGNASALVEAHASATANQATAFTVEWAGQNETGVRRYVRGENPTPYYSVFDRTTDGKRTTEQFYSTGSHGFLRVTFDDQTVYQVHQNYTMGVQAWTRNSSASPQYTLKRELASGNYTINGTVERGGRTFVQLSADEVSASWSDFYAAYEGTVLVTPEGVVHDLESSRTAESDSETEPTDVSITVDTDVEWSGPPSWVTDLPQLSLSIVEDGRAVEIRNTGGTAVPANTSFDVAGSEEATLSGRPTRGDIEGTVTTDERLEPGEAVYVTAGADGSPSSFALHDDPTSGEYTFGSAGLRGRHQNVSYWLATGIQTFENEYADFDRR
jgi:hypothetical protein